MGEETFGKLVNAMSGNGNSTIRLIENSKNKPCSEVPDWIAENRQSILRSNEDKWDASLNELKLYILEHGTTPPKKLKLGRWVLAQRAHYRNKLNGKTPALSDERVRKLNGLKGFEWAE